MNGYILSSKAENVSSDDEKSTIIEEFFEKIEEVVTDTENNYVLILIED